MSRLATDGKLLRAAFESGRTATHAALAPLASVAAPHRATARHPMIAKDFTVPAGL